MDPLRFDPDVWLETVAADKRISGFAFTLAWVIARSIRAGRWPLTVSDLARIAGRERRTVQRSFIPLEHCRFVRRRHVSACSCEIEVLMLGEPV